MSKFRFDLKANKARTMFNAMSKRIGDIAVEHVKKEVFPSQSWDGKKWKYRKGERLLKDRGRPIGIKTGDMKASVHVIRANSKGVKWGAGVSYAGYFNKGTSKMPARQFIGLDRALAGKIKREVQSTIGKIL